jgi:hypothetical protein
MSKIIHPDRFLHRLFDDCKQIELAARHENQWWRGGIFDDLDTFKSAVAVIGDTADVYTTFNQPYPRRSANCVKRGLGLGNNDMEIRRRLVFDLDPMRASGFEKHHANVREQAAALMVAGKLQRDFVDKAGWPEPAVVASGNGAHVIFPAEIAVNRENDRIIDQLYNGLAKYFGTAQVEFDLKVRNASRILRLPGTWNVGKLSASDRPPRQARVIATPDDWDRPVRIEDVIALIRRYKLDVEASRKRKAKLKVVADVTGSGDYRTLDVVRWFSVHNHYKRRLDDGKHAVTCPWHSEHSTDDTPDGTGTVVWEADGGWPTFYCSHNHCDGRALADVMQVWGDADQFCAARFEAGRFACSN